MISLDEIEKSIIELEARDTTYATCERLAWLYIVRDHINNNSLTRAATPNSKSDFMAAATTCDIDKFMDIMNEHFAIIKAVYPKEYTAVLNKIRSV